MSTFHGHRITVTARLHLRARRAPGARARARRAPPAPTVARLVLVAAAGGGAALAAALLGARSSVLVAPAANGAYRSLAIASWVGVGLQTWRLRPRSRQGPLLIAAGFVFALTTLMALPSPQPYTLGRLAWAVLVGLLAYVLLAFPHGRIERPAEAVVFRFAVTGVATLWAMLLLGSRELPIGGVLTRCEGSCPHNPYGIFSLQPGAAATLADVATIATSALLLVVAALMLARLRAARGADRATLALPFACLAGFAFAASLSSALRVIDDDGALGLALGWAAAAAGLAVPWALLAGQVRGRLIASALLERRNEKLESELLRTAAELRASRARIFAASASERRRIEHDLHDSGQNRIVALRIKLQLAAERAGEDGAGGLRDTLLELGEEAQEALDAVRAIAHGIYPPLLATGGLEAALAAELDGVALPVALSGGPVPRSTPDAEAAVYHCCLEAVQNACKHAGPRARVTVQLRCEAGLLRFLVEDDGPGFGDGEQGSGGLTYMRDRVAAVGGTLALGRAEAGGASVRGSAPWPPRADGGGGAAVSARAERGRTAG